MKRSVAFSTTMTSPTLEFTKQLLKSRDLLRKYRTSYEKAIETFSWPVLPQDTLYWNWGIDYFDKQVAIKLENKNKPVIISSKLDQDPTTITYEQLSLQSNQLANLFVNKYGIKHGDRILLGLGNIVPLWIAQLALAKIGAIAIPCTLLLNENEIKERVTRGKAIGVIGDENFLRKILAVEMLSKLRFVSIETGCTQRLDNCIDFLREMETESTKFIPKQRTSIHDTLKLYFTSGTTSAPKLVVHSHLTYPIGSLSTMYWLGLRPNDVHLNLSSPGWAKHAWSSYYAPFLGECSVLTLNHDRFDPNALLYELVKHKVTSFCAPPTVWRNLLLCDLRSFPVHLTEICSAGEPLNPEVIKQVESAWGLTIRDASGQKIIPGSMGRVLPGYHKSVGIYHEENDDNISKNELIINQPIPYGVGKYEGKKQDIPIHYGDICERDENGYYFFIGRSDDVFKSSDYKISPFELESVLIEHPKVVEAAIIPSPDSIRLCVPKAFII